MCVSVFFPRTHSKCMVSYTSTQSRMTPIWKHDSCSPRGDNSYLLFIVTDGRITRGTEGHLAQHVHSITE